MPGSSNDTTFNCVRRWQQLWMIGVLIALLSASNAMAAVTMIGTRIIYPGELRERILQFTNEGPAPSIVQVWVDQGDASKTLETARSAFVVTPQIFRVQPQTGQAVRLILTDGAALPHDQESVFYLNFSQVPALNQADQGSNRLVLLLNSRLKLFYRPPGLSGSSANMGNQLLYSWSDAGITVHNPTPYHAVLYNAQLSSSGMVWPLPGIGMIAPRATAIWPVENEIRARATASILRVGIINDFGAIVYTDHPLP